MSPRVKPKQLPRAFDEDAAFWKYLLTPAIPAPLGGAHYGLDREEHRVLSKASNAAGGYLVPTSLDDQITAARRARAVIGAISRELITGDGTTLLVPSTTTHGVATWTAENASYTASDEVFGQVSVGAFKGATQVIVSEELARDALADFEGYLSDELGVRIATLEETAFAVGDGSGKPLGVSTSGNGVATVTAATGSSWPTSTLCGLHCRTATSRTRAGSCRRVRSEASRCSSTRPAVSCCRRCTLPNPPSFRGRVPVGRPADRGCERALRRGRRLLDRLPRSPRPRRGGPAARGDLLEHRPARLSRVREARRSCDRCRRTADSRQFGHMSVSSRQGCR